MDCFHTTLLARIFFVVTLVILPWVSYADTQFKNVLIVIGYIDENNFSENLNHLFRTKHHPELVAIIETAISDMLQARKQSNVQVTVLNANVLCPGENDEGFNFRISLCQEQQIQSTNIMNFLQTNLNKYDELIYIGHSRDGAGMGIGPFIPEFTFKPQFFNEIELGKLKKVVMASCDSNKLYSYLNSRVILKGTEDKMMLIRDLLPFVLRELWVLINI